MFQNDELKNHLETSFSVQSQSALIAEWNMNVPGNIYQVGNYRYRPSGIFPRYSGLPNFFDPLDNGGFYTGATDSDVTVQSGNQSDNATPLLFVSKDVKEKIYYSLTDCIKPFRPRSGINKASYFNNKYISNANQNMFLRPRYYMPQRNDEFKYWRSYRTESYQEIEQFNLRLQITQLASSGTQVTIYTSTPHGIVVGDKITISDMTAGFDSFDGTYTVTTILGVDGLRFNKSDSIISLQSVKGKLQIFPNLNNSNAEFGISGNGADGLYLIDDANPFVVYKNTVPANRIVTKVQTNVGEINLGPFKTGNTSSLEDPLFGDINKTIPKRFSIQYLDQFDKWQDAIVFDENSTRADGESPIFGSDGYLNIQYGLDIPEQYVNNFVLVATISDEDILPVQNVTGYAYLLITSLDTKGVLKIFNGSTYDTIDPQYIWKIVEDQVDEGTQFVTDFTDPSYYIETNSGVRTYREFVWVKGIRIVVKSMNTPNTPFELIEMSPRLVSNITNRLISFDVTKILSDLSSSALPVGSLNASTGSLSLFDDDDAFNINNSWNYDTESGSIIAEYVQKNIKFNFYEIIQNVEQANYYIPIKTLYSEGMPQTDQSSGTISISLRDFYFYLESIIAPQILLPEVSLSQAVCILLDSIGFSNYIFKRLDGQQDPVIPFFFIAPEQNVAEVLAQLAVSTQSAMFFDEYNNFVVMTKEYLLDDTGERPVDLVLYGSQDSNVSGINENVYPQKLSNIISIASQDQKVYNAGVVNYTTRYIQRSYGTLRQAYQIDQDKTWIYKPVLLWEVSGTESTKSLNAEKSQKYTLSAIPLKNNLSNQVPTVINNNIINNTFDLGESVYFISRFQGYFYANGEIIRYDAVQHNVTGEGNVWISNNLEYQKYFSEIPFNGKIYPTGLVRIYAQPFYENIDGYRKLKNGAVFEHGRGQFNTPVVDHSSGLDDYWSDNIYVQGCGMKSEYLYTIIKDPTAEVGFPNTVSGAAGINTALAQKSQRNGIIRNFMSSGYSTETDVSFLKSVQSGTVQSSALVFNGPDFSATDNPRNFISYVWKQIPGAFKHFGTRIRIIGKTESDSDRTQTVSGGMSYFSVSGSDPTDNLTIGGGSAGISIVNPETNNGYFFELAALTTTDVQSYLQESEDSDVEISIDNIIFYKIKRNSSATSNSDLAIPVKMWGGFGNVLVDDGNFVGQYRFVGERNPTVYDLSFEYIDISPTLRVIYLYINNNLVSIVNDTDPVPFINPCISLFVRGTSRAMFENIYGLSKNYSQNAVFDLNVPISSVFNDADSQINATEALTKYALSGMVQKTYLSGINPNTSRDYDIYYEEFGTILRECAYFNVQYDRAYPALYAVIAPTFNRLKGYSISGFTAGSYGAEFLIFNNTDTVLNLDETTGNYLRILGVTFTQDTTQTLTVDDYFKKKGNLSETDFVSNPTIDSPFIVLQRYDEVKDSRIKYGKNEFSLDTPYIQDQDTAENMLGWIINKGLRPRKSVGVNIFSMPILQLGDVVTIDYTSNNGVDVVSSPETRFTVYNISYSRSVDGPTMTVYLSEV